MSDMVAVGNDVHLHHPELGLAGRVARRQQFPETVLIPQFPPLRVHIVSPSIDGVACLAVPSGSRGA
jgi:hypothetical protein